MKNLIMLLMFTFILVLTACGGTGEEEGNDEGNDEGSDAETTDDSSTDNTNVEAEFVLSFGTHLTDDHNLTQNAVLPWIERVEELSDGRVTFEHYSNSQMGPATDTFDLVQSGTLDVGYTLYMEDSLPIMDFPMLPGLYSDPEAGTAAYWAVLNKEPFITELEDIGIKPIMAVVWEPYTIGTVDQKVETVEEISRLQLRSSGGLHDEAADALGATPVSISASESLEALRRGTVDGYWGSTTSWTDYQFTEVLQYGIRNLPLNGWGGVFSMNSEVYDNLPSDIQDIIDQASEEVNAELGPFIKDYTRTEAWESAEEEGVEVYDVSEEVVTEVEELLEPLSEQWLEEQEQSGYPVREIYDQFINEYDNY